MNEVKRKCFQKRCPGVNLHKTIVKTFCIEPKRGPPWKTANKCLMIPRLETEIEQERFVNSFRDTLSRKDSFKFY